MPHICKIESQNSCLSCGDPVTQAASIKSPQGDHLQGSHSVSELLDIRRSDTRGEASRLGSVFGPQVNMQSNLFLRCGHGKLLCDINFMAGSNIHYQFCSIQPLSRV